MNITNIKTSTYSGKNHGIVESLTSAFDSAVLGYYPVTCLLELGSTLATGHNQIFTTPWSSAQKVMTSKFIRVLTTKVVSGDCNDHNTLNFFQQQVFCINEATQEALMFRSVVAFTAGTFSSMIFKGVPLFAIYDGLNALLYDATNELKKLDIVKKSDLSNVVNNLDSYSSAAFEGLDGYLKSIEIQAESSKFHGFIGGIIVDVFVDKVKFGVDQIFYGSLSLLKQNLQKEKIIDEINSISTFLKVCFNDFVYDSKPGVVIPILGLDVQKEQIIDHNEL